MATGKLVATEAAEDTRHLAGILRRVNVGEMVTYDALGTDVGRNVKGPARYVLDSARRIVGRDGVVFGAVTGEGLRRLDDVGKVGTADDGINRIRRQARRGRRILDTVQDYAGLNPQQQDRLNAARCVFGAVGLVTDAKGVAKIEAKVSEKHAELAARQGLALFANE